MAPVNQRTAVGLRLAVDGLNATRCVLHAAGHRAGGDAALSVGRAADEIDGVGGSRRRGDAAVVGRAALVGVAARARLLAASAANIRARLTGA